MKANLQTPIKLSFDQGQIWTQGMTAHLIFDDPRWLQLVRQDFFNIADR